MVRSSGSELYPSIYKVCHIKMKALVTNHLISKRWGRIYSDHLEYELPQDDGDGSNPIMFQQYLSSLTAKTCTYARDQLFYAISCDKDPATIHFMYFPRHKGHFMMLFCQGNGSAPQIWSIIISVVFSALWSQGFGIRFENSFLKEVEKLVGFSYVDDWGMVQLDVDIESTYYQIQLSILEWEGLIRIVGGYLVPDKSVWYLVDF